jgi:hypothetical protein
MMHRISCSRNDDIDSLEEVIDLERYQKDTLRNIKQQEVYHMGMFERRSGLYIISIQNRIECVNTWHRFDNCEQEC